MRRLYLWFRSLFLRTRLAREMREEMGLHIERATARYIARGMSPVDAAKAARREFGNFDYIEEAARDARGKRWVDAVRGDLRFAVRHFRRTPLATVTMVLVLALGIGVNVALFTVFNSLWTIPGPGIPRNESLVRIRGIDVSARFGQVQLRAMSYGEVLEYARQEQLFSAVAARTSAAALFATADPDRAAITGSAVHVSDNYFDLLNVRPALGRVWSAMPLNADPTTVLTAVISHATWERIFDSAPDVVGQTLRVNDVPATVVGVAPRGFRGGADASSRFAVWLPLAAYPIVQRSHLQVFASPDSARFWAIAQLRAGVDREQALPVIKAIAARADAARTPRVATRLQGGPMRWIATADVVPMLAHNQNPRDDGELKSIAAVIGALTLLILLITCANVSSLLVGMAVSRRREIAVRLSLGAGRRRLIGQLLTESILLALTAAALGLFVFWAVMRVLISRLPEEMLDQLIVFDWRAMLFTGGFAIVTGIIFGLSPALHATRLALADVLKDTAAAVSGSRALLQRMLVVVQITLTQPLLIGICAVLLLALSDLRKIGTSELDERIVLLNYDEYVEVAPAAESRNTLARIRERLAALPGVVGAVAEGWVMSRSAVAHPADRHLASSLPDTIRVNARMVAPGYLALRDIRIMRGRDFFESEMDSIISSVIIGDDFARRLFGAADPIGRRLRFERDSSYMEVVGVADETAMEALRWSPPASYQPIIFWPINTQAVPGRIMVRTHGPAEALLPHLRVTAAFIAPQVPLSGIRTVQQARELSRQARLQAFAAIGAAGLLALLLSAVGLYAVVSFAVTQRTREIGIRTALGAHRSRVVGLFFMSGVRLSVLGLTLGLPLSLIALRVLRDETGMPPINTAAVAASVAVGVLIVAGLATWLPARRAASVDPLSALRSE